ncbi:TPA: hypothetical protein V0499_002064 [Streptococcus pneumoniae]|nr:hypothetical protein [Streptococcus pneumoniae]
MFKRYVPTFFRVVKHRNIKAHEICSESIKKGLIAGMESENEELSATIKKINY